MKKYRYTSINPCHINIKVGENMQPFSLYQGEVYELPQNAAAVKRMVAQGYLKMISITAKNKSNG